MWTCELSFFPPLIVLVLARVAGFLGAWGFLGRPTLPFPARILTCVAVALAFVPLLPAAWFHAAGTLVTLPSLFYSVAGEVLIGAGLSLVYQVFRGACRMGGYLAGFSSSLMMAQAIDPSSGVSVNLPGRIVESLFLLLLFLCDVHLVFLRLLAESFHGIPPFRMAATTGWMGTLPRLGGLVFSWGFRLGLPMLAMALLIDTGMALAARLAPEFEILFLSLSMRLLVGLMLLGLVLMFAGDVLRHMMEEALDHIAAILHAQPS